MKNKEKINQTIQLILSPPMLEKGGILPTHRVEEDFDSDSLDCLELGMALEETFRCQVESEEAAGWKTVEDIYRTMESLGVELDNKFPY